MLMLGPCGFAQGTGAGFYLNATKAPYKGVYNMCVFVLCLPCSQQHVCR